jgi:hypothetical protein
MENQNHLMDTIGPMYVQQQQEKAAQAAQAQQIQPDASGNVTLSIT